MNILPLQLQAKIDASEIPMDQIAGNKALTQEQKIGEATRQFEAMLLRQILESTQKTVIKSKYSEDSTATGIYRDMITSQLADSISKSGSLGLGETLKREFTQQTRGTKNDSQMESKSSDAEAPASELLCHSAKQLSSHSQPVLHSPKYGTRFP